MSTAGGVHGDLTTVDHAGARERRIDARLIITTWAPAEDKHQRGYGRRAARSYCGSAMTTEAHAVADRLFAAIEAGDRATVAATIHDDAEVWHSITRRTVDKARCLAILDWFMAPGVERTYEVHERLLVGDRLVQRHTLRVTVPGHPVIEMPVCIWLTIEDGAVTRIDEFPDQVGTDALFAAIPPG